MKHEMKVKTILVGIPEDDATPNKHNHNVLVTLNYLISIVLDKTHLK